MSRTRLAALGAAGLLTLVLAACGGGGTATAAPTSPPASSPAATSAAPSPADSPTAAADVCAPTDSGGTVAATARGFAFAPATINVAAGEAVTWSNGDSAPHSIVLDGGECETETFGEGASATIVFNVPGTYPFHCGVHPNMTGTVNVS